LHSNFDQKGNPVVKQFGIKYKHWNTVFDSVYAATLGKPLTTLNEPENGHALKEVEAAALAVAEKPEQVVRLLNYVINGTL